jgi:soluble lytic murein transglycosylase
MMTAALALSLLVGVGPGGTETSTSSPWLRARAAAAASALGPLRAALAELPAAPLLDDHRALLDAERLRLEGDLAAARARLEGVGEASPDPVLAPRAPRATWIPARRALAALVGPADPRRAAAILGALPSDAATEAARLAWLERAGDAVGAAAARRALLTRFAATREGLERAAALGAEAVLAALPEADARLARAEALLDGHENDAAARLAAKLVDDAGASADTRCRAALVVARARRKLRSYKPATQAVARAVELCRDDDPRRLSARLLAVQLGAIRGAVGATRAAVTALVDDAPAGHRFVDDALVLLGQLEQKRGDDTRAARTLRRVLDEHPTGDQAGEAAWSLGFQALVADDRVAARRELERAAAAAWREDVDRARALYWLARLDERERPAEACAAHVRTVTETGLGFFTWQTLAHLGRADATCRRRAIEALDARLAAPGDAALAERDAALAASPLVARARALAAVGLVDDARLELQPLEAYALTRRGDAPAPTPDEARAWRTLAEVYAAIGLHADAQRILRARLEALFRAPPDAATAPWWRAAYSRAYADAIEPAARAEKLDPWLLFALAREESTFDPAIVSWAGAIGLTQLMPGTAEVAYRATHKGAKKTGLLDRAALVEPALNARLGAWVLRDALGKYKGTVPLALGAYNGGPGLVRTFLPKADAEPYDLFAERAGVRETRRYMQRVSGTWGTYHFLHARGEDRFVALPEAISPTGTATRAAARGDVSPAAAP